MSPAPAIEPVASRQVLCHGRKGVSDRAVCCPDARVMLGWFKRHRVVLALLVVSTVIAAVCTKENVSGNLTVAAATARVAVDFPDASIIARSADPQDL